MFPYLLFIKVSRQIAYTSEQLILKRPQMLLVAYKVISKYDDETGCSTDQSTPLPPPHHKKQRRGWSSITYSPRNHQGQFITEGCCGGLPLLFLRSSLSEGNKGWGYWARGIQNQTSSRRGGQLMGKYGAWRRDWKSRGQNINQNLTPSQKMRSNPFREYRLNRLADLWMTFRIELVPRPLSPISCTRFISLVQ